MDSPNRPDRESTEQDLQDRIAAYLDGEMTSDEGAAFERLMEADKSLRREVDQWRDAFEAARDWLTAEPPGIERVDDLAIPSVARRRARAMWTGDLFNVFLRPYVWRTVAAAVIFVAGFFVGLVTHSEFSPPEDRGEIKRGVEQVTSEPTPAIPRTSGKESREAPVEPQSKGAVQLAQLPSLRHSIDEKGRIIIETGARAVWVVDGNFQIAKTSLIAKGGKP